MQKVILAVWTLSLNLSFLDKAKQVKVLKSSVVHIDFVSLPLFWYQICCHIEIFPKCTHLKISSSLSYNVIFFLIPLWRSTKMFFFVLFLYLNNISMGSEVLVTQLCLTLGHPTLGSLPCSSVCVILQARTLEWVAIPISRGSSQPRDWTRVSCMAGRFLNLLT